ncbi:hypothetical protein ncot_11535 [Nocardioides sp. JQ2195]|uniref:hypothetical protein n=1 Tax=Nocardioides sp. JQ2195 TaxID=2592334 RepID=UPI00143EB9AE|nr:hypothetical protein [Nocardioides sp. JQ2195]QIX27159.1 hypothetical protein ncot_11535 [Nocardioides sp. JQ2195]
MSQNTQQVAGGAAPTEVVDWTELGMRMWSFLTGREAAINYEFQEMEVEIPRDTGQNAPRATWRLNGTLRVTTDDRASARPASPRAASPRSA